jgi:hypothetical protein
MSLHDLIENDARLVFTNTSDFAEVVTYYKRNGVSREVDAVIIRDGFAQLGEDPDNVIPMFEVHVGNTQQRGITSEELDRGGDQLAFPVKVGEKPTKRSIVRLVSHDEGMLILECR